MSARKYRSFGAKSCHCFRGLPKLLFPFARYFKTFYLIQPELILPSHSFQILLYSLDSVICVFCSSLIICLYMTSSSQSPLPVRDGTHKMGSPLCIVSAGEMMHYTIPLQCLHYFVCFVCGLYIHTVLVNTYIYIGSDLIAELQNLPRK